VTTPDEATVAAKAEGFDYPVMLCGHTHVPRAVRLKDGRLIVNPGAVGLQFNIGSPDARYATIELRGGKYYPSFHAVPYDHYAAARQAEANGFPQWRDALVTGWAGAEGLFQAADAS
jgi:diadenosine tetraphosphatase ApaH/serine/threonine PP2A family protein phosphatase